MRMKHDFKIFRLLERENLGHRFFRPVLHALAVCAITFLFMIFVILFIPEDIGNELIFKVPIGGFLIALILFMASCLRSRERPAVTAVLIDKKLGGKSRLEAAFELVGTKSPVRDAQIENAENHFRACRSVNWKLILFVMTLSVLAMLISQVTLIVLIRQGKLEFQPFAKEKPAVVKDKKVEKEIPGFAELLILEPDPEMQCMPLEAIAWRAKANSTHGFKDLELVIGINGEEVKRIQLKKDNVKGEFFLDGEFYLDEVKAQPFSLISYYLCGRSKMNLSENQEVASSPNFIQVIPFKEDSLFKKMESEMKMESDGEMKEIAGTIYKIMKAQIRLNRETISARVPVSATEEQAMQTQIEFLAGAQDVLKKELKELMDGSSGDSMELSANMFDCLQKAVENMQNATGHLNDIKKYGREE